MLKNTFVFNVVSFIVILKSGMSERVQVAEGIAAESVKITFLLRVQLTTRKEITEISRMLLIVFPDIETLVFSFMRMFMLVVF